MPLYKQVKEDALQWAIWRMDESLDQLAALVPYGDKLLAECAHFASEHRRKELVGARVLLHHLLQREEPVAYLPSGKPYLVSGAYHISISHTADYVAVALHSQHEVGIDVERFGMRALRLKDRFVREDESLEPPAVYTALLHWSAKETAFKLLDCDEVDFKQHLRITPFYPQTEGIFTLTETRTEEQKRFRIHYLVTKDFVLTLAWMNRTQSPQLSKNTQPL